MSIDPGLAEMRRGEDNGIDNYGNIRVLSHVNRVLQSSFHDGENTLIEYNNDGSDLRLRGKDQHVSGSKDAERSVPEHKQRNDH